MSLFWNSQSTAGPKFLLAGALLLGTSFGVSTTLPGRIYMPDTSGTKSSTLCARSLDDSGESQATIASIQKAIQSQDLDEDETIPLPTVIAEATRIIRQAAEQITDMPEGRVSIFFGELNITWRVADKIVRLVCFQHRPSLIQFGSLSAPMGSYRSERASSDKLVEHLAALYETA